MKRGEKQAPVVDFYFPFTESNLGIRQETIISRAGIFFFAPGGPGTFSEFGAVLARKGFYQSHEPVFMLNSQGYFDAWRQLVEEMCTPRHGMPPRMNPQMAKDIYYLTHGAEFYPLLMNHYKFKQQ